MEEVYSAADFAIGRSGAASLAELATFSLPAILIPFPYAAEDHQTRNAEIFARAEAGIILKEADLSDDLLARKIRELTGDPDKLLRMAENSARLAPRNAAALVVETMERYTQSNHDARL
jgi:UDP-N-acetylglucosamine--N-acetylmuramyl-(pentapeptide) pyrophosphoryl-undecaprenol N-acetylglucosamine transferase